MYLIAIKEKQNTAIFKRIVCQVFANVNGGESYAIA